MHFAMEEMIIGKQNLMISNNNTPSSSCFQHNPLGIRKVPKVKPKIRIIHIFAPEIIKTDVANFRELVQRLTGKPDTENNSPAAASTSTSTSGKIRRSRKKIPAEAARSNIINQEGPTTTVMMMEPPNFVTNNEDFCFTFPDNIDGFIQGISELPLHHHVLHPFESPR